MFGDLFEMMDAAVCDFYKISMEQLNHLSEASTEEELTEFLSILDPEVEAEAFMESEELFVPTKEMRVKMFSKIRRGIEIRDKYLKLNGAWIQL